MYPLLTSEFNRMVPGPDKVRLNHVLDHCRAKLLHEKPEQWHRYLHPREYGYKYSCGLIPLYISEKGDC